MHERPLRILWLIDHVCYDGSLHGGGRLFWDLLPQFDTTQAQVFPYFLRASDDVRRVFANAPAPVEVLNKSKYDPTSLMTVLSLCRRHKIDVMHLFCYASSIFGRLAGVLTGIPTVIHDFDTQIYFPYPFYLKVLDRVLAQSTGRALAASPMCRNYMHNVRKIPLDRIDLFLHAIPDQRFELPTRTQKTVFRAALGWDQDAVIFCTVTKLGPERGNESLLQAFAKLAATRKNVYLAVVYKPTYYHRVPQAYAGIESINDPAQLRRSLEQLALKLGIADNVQFVESFDKPEMYLLGSDVFVVPFENERFSSVNLLEAFAYCRPAIATETGEQSVVIEEGKNGLLVPPGNVEALAAAMIRLADNPLQRQQMGLSAAASVQQYSVSAAATRMSHMYAHIAAGQKNSAASKTHKTETC